MADTTLHQSVDFDGSGAGLADRGGGPSFQEGGSRECVPTIGE